MNPTNLTDEIRLCYFCIILFMTSSQAVQRRVVFPYDVVRFSCSDVRSVVVKDVPTSALCTLIFNLASDTGETSPNSTKVTEECTKTSTSNQKDIVDTYDAYIEIPEQATGVSCNLNDRLPISVDKQELDVQGVKLAKHFFTNNMSSPQIILQRFSNDFGARLGSHDVTNHEIKVNGEEVESMNLLCIHFGQVTWKNISEPQQRILNELNRRNDQWLHSESGNLEKKWKEYLSLLLGSDKTSYRDFKRQPKDQMTFTAGLTIRNISNATSRRYECMDMENRESSFVQIMIDNPRAIGPDEIQMIQQITEILDSLAKGKGQGNGPWYTLASLLSIVLILILYYCKQKYSQASNSSKPQCPPGEETQLRTRLQQSELFEQQVECHPQESSKQSADVNPASHK